jgi:hypothetical protein
MRCEITVQWRDGYEELEMSRESDRDQWGGETDQEWRLTSRVVDQLDKTYQDLRKSLLAMMPEEAREGHGVMVRLTEEQARDFPEQA